MAAGTRPKGVKMTDPELFSDNDATSQELHAVSDLVADALARLSSLDREAQEIAIMRMSEGLFTVKIRWREGGLSETLYTWSDGDVNAL